ncbi:MAG: hypothetical protein KKH41_03965 [Candidatus Thermoplasmatota archaeon]|nr:hypothetical protein [Euryarchaeota archaeon]MBU4031333.1 hypothetical protein [Candidatus Thermoplasmatota archaeon]MBU4071385.1 hypothetical protein [Candidatus Thermoplasmatota archaeon]MBU4143489.1 hypothetical protein [Candidatus Thermoplasmatota archaeon]MBU4591723.1 hypothetical protein [Candidatus Thermoplasmatota archaeon]
MDESQKIEETIATITNQFHRKPHNFFNEHEFHQYCYYVFYSKPEFSKQYTTLDGKKTNILKREYPSIARFSRKRIEIDPVGDRAHYDMAILNPEFIQNNNYHSVTNKDIRHSSGNPSNLIAALEFKYITKHSKAFHHEIKYDLFKLSQAREARLKYSLIFCNTIKGERDYFEGLEISEDVDVRYVTVWEEGGRKMVRVEKAF